MKYNELYEIVTKYYPVGLDELDIGYSEYPGMKEFLNRVNVMFASENYEGKWKAFISSFKLGTNEMLEANWQSPLSDWCYTGSLMINRRNMDDLTHIKELIINVSFLAPLYSIYSRDRIEYLDNGSLMEFNPFLTVSPFGSYEKLFALCREKIEREYPGYRLIPFNLLSEKIKSIYVPGSINGLDATVYQALFKLHDITILPYHGDPSYE